MAEKEIVSYDPIERIFNLRGDFDDIIRDFFSGFSNVSVSKGVYPLLDIREDKEKYSIAIEIPGVEKKDLKISVKKEKLIIQGEKKEEKKRKEESYLRVERSYGKFMRSISLPTEVDQSKITAKYNNGVLKITLPKIEKEKAKEVKVEIA
jgi:HSP20 family protein